MKTCPACGLAFDDSCRFCAEDGVVLMTPDTDVVESPLSLHCPACGGDYPLTFSECPTDRLPLRAGPRKPPAQTVGTQTARASMEPPVVLSPSEDSEAIDAGSERDTGLGGQTEVAPGGDSTDQSPAQGRGLRLAASGVRVGIVIFALAAAYVLYSAVTRGPSRQPKLAVANQAGKLDSPLVPTPESAKNYTDEPESPSEADQPPQEGAVSPEPTQPAETRRPGREPSSAVPAQQPHAEAARDQHVARAADAALDVQLVRVRSRRLPFGYLYDLTFTQRDLSGQVVRWNRLAIVTRAASGSTHSETVAFPYRLGPSGLLTFTLNVAMHGATDADWRGRVLCTSFGSDEAGRPLRASFGATLSPW